MIRVIHVITADDPFGEPWPPSSTDNWHVVRRKHGFTKWRAIQVVQPEPPPAGAQSIPGGNRNSHSN